MLKAIIFDLDGVLIDSEPLMRFAFAESYRQVLGDGTPPVEQYLEHMGDSFPSIMDRLGLPHDLWTPYRAICRQESHRICTFPWTGELLSAAVKLDLKLAILTGKDYDRTIEILEDTRLIQYFDAVVASDQLSHPKPHPEGVQCALQALNCRPDEAVAVGDAVYDILSAQRADVCAIAVTWGIKPERVQTLCTPDYIVHTAQSLIDTFRSLRVAGVPSR
jgi:3-amino-5-hydroxybenzoic acid synthesis related protein